MRCPAWWPRVRAADNMSLWTLSLAVETSQSRCRTLPSVPNSWGSRTREEKNRLSRTCPSVLTLCLHLDFLWVRASSARKIWRSNSRCLRCPRRLRRFRRLRLLALDADCHIPKILSFNERVVLFWNSIFEEDKIYIEAIFKFDNLNDFVLKPMMFALRTFLYSLRYL